MMKYKLLVFVLCFMTAATGYSQETVPEESDPEEQVETEVFVGTFGCILPLTGSYSRLGEMALRGVRTAVENAGKHGQYRVVLKDSASTKEGATAAFNEIFSESNPSFIIGPLPSKHIAEIENSGSYATVPVVIFPVFDRSNRRRNIHSYSLPVNSQVETLAEYSLSQLKLKKFAVLRPNTNAAAKMTAPFKEILRKKGGKIVYDGQYETDLSDIDIHVQWLQAYKLDAVFIPDGAENSSYIIKKIIADDDIANLIFLGPNTWNSNIFYDLSRNDFDGVLYKIVFTDFIDMKSRDWTDFSNLYKSIYNERPSTFQYQIYSATLYFLEKDLNRQSPEEIRIVSDEITLKPKTMIFTMENGEVIRIK